MILKYIPLTIPVVTFPTAPTPVLTNPPMPDSKLVATPVKLDSKLLRDCGFGLQFTNAMQEMTIANNIIAFRFIFILYYRF